MNESENINTGEAFKLVIKQIEQLQAQIQEIAKVKTQAQEQVQEVINPLLRTIPYAPYASEAIKPRIGWLVPYVSEEVSFPSTNKDILSQDEYDELSKLSIEIDSNLQSIAASQIRTEKDREDIKRLDEEINSLLESL